MKPANLLLNKAEPHIMHIDLNSCFSTIEQQANPLIRNKPVAVAAYTSGNGMVLAASYDAKALGIKLGINVQEARKLCPGLIVLMPDAAKYREAHKRFREVLLEYTSDVVPKSIDEFVINFAGSEALRQGRDLVDVGYEIKERIKESLGEYVTVNVGIAPNRFLAKLAASLHKPDGLDVITHENLLETLATIGLRDLPGINYRYEARLRAAGIGSPLDFLHAEGKFLKNFVFYSKVGHYWQQRLRGWEVDDREFARKTIGHQYALQTKTSDRDELARLLMKLSEKVGRRLRGAGLNAGGIHLSIRFINSERAANATETRSDLGWHTQNSFNPHRYLYWREGHKTSHALYATQDIFLAARELFKKAGTFPDKVSQLSLTLYDLGPTNPEQLGLFEETTLRQKRLASAADIVNDRYGEFTVVPAIMADMEKVILDRVAFGGIRDL
jgi:DNA polymerase-4